ncbi:hypothetical protein MMC20_001405 [Loxospora ochrophaea]|nr:hypothetical protein [Loxospora ochrophaea]
MFSTTIVLSLAVFLPLITAVSSGCALSVEVPGGQQVYVQTNGALGFTEAHSGVVPAGAATGNFTETLPAEGFGDFGFTGFGSPGGWLACPVSSAAAETGPWQVFAAIAGLSDADVPSGNVSQCIDFDALSSAASGAGAWQYD